MSNPAVNQTETHSAHYQEPTDAEVRAILSACKTIAVVGLSPKLERPSYGVAQFLMERGYQVVGINPGFAGKAILGAPVYATLSDAAKELHIDMVDCFRASDAMLPIAEEAIAIGADYLWMQLGVENTEAAELALRAGLQVVMNRCPKIELRRLT